MEYKTNSNFSEDNVQIVKQRANKSKFKSVYFCLQRPITVKKNSNYKLKSLKHLFKLCPAYFMNLCSKVAITNSLTYNSLQFEQLFLLGG